MRKLPLFSSAMLGGIDSGIRIEKGKSCCYIDPELGGVELLRKFTRTVRSKGPVSSLAVQRFTGLGPTKS